MESIFVTKVYCYEIPKEKYDQLLNDTKTNKLFHLERGTEEFNKAIDTLEELVEEKGSRVYLESIEISDEDY